MRDLVIYDPHERLLACEWGDSNGLLVYRLSHNKQGDPHPVEPEQVLSTQESERLDKFRVWLTSAAYGYAHNANAVFNDCVIYRCNDSGVPEKYEPLNNLTGEEDFFTQLPKFLQAVFIQNKFEPDEYQQAQVIRQLLLLLTEHLEKVAPDTHRALTALTTQLIRTGGNDTLFSIDTLTPLNISCLTYTQEYASTVNQAHTDASIGALLPQLDTMSPTDIAKLGYMMRHLSRAGALGYHVGSDNVANPLFYSWASICFHKLNSMPHGGITFPDAFLARLISGDCAAALSTQFLNANPGLNLQDIYRKRT